MKIHRLGSQLEVHAPAKINLFLEIHGKRADGFHEIETVMTRVSVFDTLHFAARSDGQIHLKSYLQKSGPPVPLDSSNLIYQALEKIRNLPGFSNRCLGADVCFSKRIPSSAGMGGASSDAAASLVAANRIWNLELEKPALFELAAELGSDVPFFLQEHAALCTGRGEIIHPVPAAGGLPVVVAMPPVGLSTPEIYRNYAAQSPEGDRRDSKTIVDILRCARWRSIADGMFNRLESVAGQLTDWIGRIRQAFAGLPSCIGFQMSGSGSSYFGAFPNQVAARQAAHRLSNRLPGVRILMAHTLGPSPVLNYLE